MFVGCCLAIQVVFSFFSAVGDLRWREGGGEMKVVMSMSNKIEAIAQIR